MKSKKAISPLIATVLVIGFAIVLGVMIFSFGKGLVTQMTETQKTAGEKLQKCTELSNLKIESCIYTGNNNLNITVSSLVNIPVESFLVRIGPQENIKSGTIEDGLEPASIKTFETTIENVGSLFSEADTRPLTLIPQIEIGGKTTACDIEIKGTCNKKPS